MLRGMTAPQWLQWKAWLQASARHLEAERADHRAAVIAAAAWNVQIAKANGAAAARGATQSRLREPHEFMAKWGDMEDPRPTAKKPTQAGSKSFWAGLHMLADSLGKAK
jgi:hypothetical protein